MKIKGKLIALVGTDCSGKETQSKKLVERLVNEGEKAELMDFPQYNSPTGRIIGQCYLGKDLPKAQGDTLWFGDANSVSAEVASLYYAADRKYHLPKMNEILDSGSHLILDRYVSANKCHQGGKIESSEERLKFWNWLDELEHGLLGLPKPEHTVFLYMPLEVAYELKAGREEKSDSHEGNPEHLRNAENAYLELAELENWIKIDCAPDKTLETLKTPKQIHEEVWQKVGGLILPRKWSITSH